MARALHEPRVSMYRRSNPALRSRLLVACALGAWSIGCATLLDLEHYPLIPDDDAAAPDASDGAATRFCDRQQGPLDAAAFYCRDYEDPDAAQPSGASSATLAIEADDASGGNHSLVLRVPPLSSTQASTGGERLEIGIEPSTLSLSFDLRVEASVKTNIMGIRRPPNHNMHFAYDPSAHSLQINEQDQSDGGNAFKSHQTGALAKGTWSRVELTISYAKRTFSFRIDGRDVSVDEPLALPTPSPVTRVDIGVIFVGGPSASAGVYRFDNVVVRAYR